MEKRPGLSTSSGTRPFLLRPGNEASMFPSFHIVDVRSDFLVVQAVAMASTLV